MLPLGDEGRLLIGDIAIFHLRRAFGEAGTGMMPAVIESGIDRLGACSREAACKCAKADRVRLDLSR